MCNEGFFTQFKYTKVGCCGSEHDSYGLGSFCIVLPIESRRPYFKLIESRAINVYQPSLASLLDIPESSQNLSIYETFCPLDYHLVSFGIVLSCKGNLLGPPRVYGEGVGNGTIDFG